MPASPRRRLSLVAAALAALPSAALVAPGQSSHMAHRARAAAARGRPLRSAVFADEETGADEATGAVDVSHLLAFYREGLGAEDAAGATLGATLGAEVATDAGVDPWNPMFAEAASAAAAAAAAAANATDAWDPYSAFS